MRSPLSFTSACNLWVYFSMTRGSMGSWEGTVVSVVGSSEESLSRLADFTTFLSSFVFCFLLFRRSCMKKRRPHNLDSF